MKVFKWDTLALCVFKDFTHEPWDFCVYRFKVEFLDGNYASECRQREIVY